MILIRYVLLLFGILGIGNLPHFFIQLVNESDVIISLNNRVRNHSLNGGIFIVLIVLWRLILHLSVSYILLRAIFIQAYVLFFYASVSEGSQHRRNSSIRVLKLPIQPLVSFLVIFLFDYISMQFFQQLLLVRALKMAVHLKSLLKLSLVVDELLPLRRYVVQVLNYCILTVQKHNQHRHRLYVLLGEVGMLKLDEIVFVVDLKAASLGAKTIQELLLRILMIWLVELLARVGALRLNSATF